MARIRGLEPHEAKWRTRPVYWICRRLFGKVLASVKILARTPILLWTEGLLGQALERSGKVEPRIRILAKLRTAQRVGCVH